LNEGPPAYPITYDPKQPLALNPFLVDSSRSYAQFLITCSEFSHTADGRQPWERMAAAGYVFAAPSGFNESALKRGGGNPDLGWLAEVDVYTYYTDPGVPGRWHRLNIFDPSMKEMGAGIATGTFGALCPARLRSSLALHTVTRAATTATRLASRWAA
jgi:uncharacterized protein YkwD